MRTFDFLNGLHDAANSIATPLLTLVQAVAFAAVFNFAACFLTIAFPSLQAVANTIGKRLIDKDLVTPGVVFGALIRASFWNVIIWLKGVPSSSSHALVNGRPWSTSAGSNTPQSRTYKTPVAVPKTRRSVRATAKAAS